jgi:HAD superfamily hydrolase (TIGR01509 family)
VHLRDEIDVILFDNDGVLVDTEPLFLEATRQLLETVDVRIDLETYRDLCLVQGKSVFDLAERKGLSPTEIRSLRAQRDARYMELIEAGVAVIDGVDELLPRLHGIRPLAIVTSSGRPHFERIHDQTGLLRYFEFVLADGDYARHKPHPDPYLAAARRFEVDCGRCLVIEDTERGLEAAHAAGMRCIAIPNALSETGNFENAEHVLGSVRELASLLDLS